MRVFAFSLLLALAFGVTAKSDNISLVHSKETGIEWQLHVVESGLANVLDEVSQVGNVRIHYSTLPQSIVSAVCVGSTIELILKCLFGSDLNLIFRYEEDAPVPRLVDVWIVGSALVKPNGICESDSQNQYDESISKTSDSKIDFQLKKTLNIFEQGNSKQRASALAKLISNTRFKKDRIEEVLQKANHDKAEIVRLQALVGYVSRFGVDFVHEELQRAFQDPEASVRIKVVEYSDDPDLLLQASFDEDSLVRSLAKHKLDLKRDVID